MHQDLFPNNWTNAERKGCEGEVVVDKTLRKKVPGIH